MNIRSYIKRLHLLLIMALVTGLGLVGWDASAALASSKTYIVSKTADTADGTCDSDCSLREAIMAANANPGADTIALSAKAYTLTIGGADENNSATGDLDIAEDLTIDGAGAGQTIIKGGAGWDDRIFDVVSYGAVVVLDGLTITKGNAVGGGGGISNIGTLALNNSIVSGNTSSYAGGGIYDTSGGMLTLDNSLVSGNTAGAGGGVSSVNATVLLTNSAVSGNNASDGSAGISSLNSTLTVNNSTISGNTSSDYGGGISIGDSTLTVNNSTISGNTAHLGAGGINNVGSTLAVNNSTISGNTTTSGTGGGIINLGALGPYTAGTTILNNVTIANNSALDGGGIANSGTLKLKNSLVAGNSAASAPDCNGTLVSQGYNLLGSSAGCGGLTDGVGGDRVGSAAHPLDPKLGPLQGNGGATFTRALLSNSPAIDAGSPAACAATDQRGVARPQGIGCDIGAYEFDGSIKQNQTISFASLPNKTIGDAPFSVSASASSGLKVTFTASGQCSISGSLVTLMGAGSCTIIAHQVGDVSYNAAADVAQSFLISDSAQNGGFVVHLPLVVR